jgi:RimJ/RimL family protein N-acetyltransferase
MTSDSARRGASAPTLTDGIIVLNGFTLDDVEEHLAGEDDEQARRFGWYPKRSTEQTVRAAITRWTDEWRSGGRRLAWASRDAESGRMVGGVEIRLEEGARAQMAWWTFPPYRRRGLASRAIRLACEFAFAELGVQRMEAHIAPDNVGSRRAAEKAGLVLEGPVPVQELSPPEPRDMLLYARVAIPT